MSFSALDSLPPSPPAIHGRAPVYCGDSACLRADTGFANDRTNKLPGVQGDDKRSTEKNVPVNVSTTSFVSPAIVSSGIADKIQTCTGREVTHSRADSSPAKHRQYAGKKTKMSATGIHDPNKDLRREAYDIACEIRGLIGKKETDNTVLGRLHSRLNEIASASPVMSGFIRARITPMLKVPTAKKEDVQLLRKEKIERILASNKVNGEKRRMLQKELANLDKQISMRPEVKKRRFLTAKKELEAVSQHKKRIRAYEGDVKDVSAFLGNSGVHRMVERGLRNFDHNRKVVKKRENRKIGRREEHRGTIDNDEKSSYEGFKIDAERDLFMERIYAIISRGGYTRANADRMNKFDILAGEEEYIIADAQYEDGADIKKNLDLGLTKSKYYDEIVAKNGLRAKEAARISNEEKFREELHLREVAIMDELEEIDPLLLVSYQQTRSSSVEFQQRIELALLDTALLTDEAIFDLPLPKKTKKYPSKEPKRSNATPLERKFTVS